MTWDADKEQRRRASLEVVEAAKADHEALEEEFAAFKLDLAREAQLGTVYIQQLIDNASAIVALLGPLVEKRDNRAQAVDLCNRALDSINVDPHAELRKTWAPGQQWEFMADSSVGWCTLSALSQPMWFPEYAYRRKPGTF